MPKYLMSYLMNNIETEIRMYTVELLKKNLWYQHKLFQIHVTKKYASQLMLNLAIKD